jgi:Ca2+-binding EF-hand superfamily protein
MATLIEFRQQNPEYNTVPDLALADALHQKFYADKISKPDFYKKLGLVGADIPGAEKTTALPKPEVSLRDRIMGIVETPAIIAGNVGSAVATPFMRMVGEAYGGYGTPQGKEAGEAAARTTAAQFYQPRTETGPQITGAIGDFLSAIPPTPLTSAGTALSVLAPASVNQLSPVLRQAVAPAKNVLASKLTRQQPTMQGMGAASTAEDLMREERLQRLNLPATAGERTKSLAQQQFEADVERGAISGVSEAKKQELVEQMGKFRQQQKQAISQKFQGMAEQTGAEVADPTQMRQVGKVVDKALVDAYEKKFNAYKQAYKDADTAGETLQEVPYQSIIDFVNTKTKTMRKKIDPILDSVVESLKMNDPTGKGTISIRDLEEVYQEIGKVKGSPNAKELKGLIDQATEGAGGDLYRKARAQRKELANQFENVSLVDKLLGTKVGYPEQQIAYKKIFKRVVLDGSLEEMRTVTSLLKKAGPEGRQAYAELQGQTIEHLKDLLTKGDQMSFKNFNTVVNELDFDDKLTYMFGKKGRQEIVDMRDALKDILVKQPGAVNYPNTGGAVLRGLERLEAIKLPLAKDVAQFERGRETTKRLEEALKQPNQLAAPSRSRNNLAP